MEVKRGKKIDHSRYEVRWLIGRDLPQVEAFDRYAFGKNAWSEQDWRAAHKPTNCIGAVYVPRSGSHRVLAAMIYQLHKDGIHVLRFVVHPDYHRMGVGTAMVQRLKDKLKRRTWVEIDVPEKSLPAQLLFQSCGFVFTEFVRSGSDVEYRMRYEL
jgi:ribosomal-protein-alanine N-acetyltransferase